MARAGGGGDVTKFVCGYMSCDPQIEPGIFGGTATYLQSQCPKGHGRAVAGELDLFLRRGADASRAGGEAVLAKLSELLFVETLRRYITELPPERTGWLASVRDPEVGKALALLHRQPAQPWTIADLAREVGLSRSVLAQRFRHYLDEPPISYLTRWRLQLGAQMLKSSSRSVAAIAAEVGYDSEAAFNRAFTRCYRVLPARFCSEFRAGGSLDADAPRSAIKT